MKKRLNEKNSVKVKYNLDFLESFLEKIIQNLLILFISTMFLISFMQIINRFIFHRSIFWIEEIALYLFIWVIFLGMSLGVKKSEHFRMTEIVMKLPSKIQLFLSYIRSFFMLFVLIIIFKSGYGLIKSSMGEVSLASGIPRICVYISIPIGATFAILFILKKLFTKKLDNI